MKVREFCKMYRGNELIHIELYEVNDNVSLDTIIEDMVEDNDFHEEWKNAEIKGWYIDDEQYLSLDVIK